MVTNAKLNEHPRCSCAACRRGAGSAHGQATHRRANRAIRHAYKLALAALKRCNPIPRRAEDDSPRIVISTTYTD